MVKTPVRRSEIHVAYEPAASVKRLGMIALSTDLTSERDAIGVIPRDHAAFHVTRIANQNPSTPENLRKMAPRLRAAAELLADIPDLAAVWYSCTAASVTIGDAAIAEPIKAVLPAVPVVTPSLSAVEAFDALRVRRIVLVTPYFVKTTRPISDYFVRQGLEIVNASCLGIGDDRDMARVTAQTIISAVLEADRPEAEGVFLSCTALPALGVIHEIERRLCKPVVSSNQASLWRMLHHAGISPMAESSPGRLFAVDPRENVT